MAVVNLYTQAQVQIALQRATVAMLLISQKIASGFLYLNQPRYLTYKNLQYDIYALFSTVNNELRFINFAVPTDTYEQSFMGLVGAMIEKTKTVDVYWAYNGASDPNYQAPGTTQYIVNPVFYLPPMDVYWVNLDAGSQNPDGNRYVYNNPLIKGYNPVMWLVSPASTRLFSGTDYSVFPTGGFQILNDFSGAGSPGITSGQVLTITGYE